MNKSSAVAKMGKHLATTDKGGKVRELMCPFPWGELAPHLTQCCLAEAYIHTK